MTNSADPDQLASSEGSTLFAKAGHVVLSKRRVKYNFFIAKLIANFLLYLGLCNSKTYG